MITLLKQILLEGASAKQNKQLVEYEKYNFEARLMEVILAIQVIIGCVKQEKLHVNVEGGDFVDVSEYSFPNCICKLINMSKIYLNTSAQGDRKALITAGVDTDPNTPIISPFKVEKFFEDWYKYDNTYTGQDWTISKLSPNYYGELVSNFNSICVVNPEDNTRSTFKIGDGSSETEAYSYLLDMVATVPLDQIFSEENSMNEAGVIRWFLDNRTK